MYIYTFIKHAQKFIQSKGGGGLTKMIVLKKKMVSTMRTYQR